MEENASRGEYVEEVDFAQGGEGDSRKRIENFLESRYFLGLVVVLVALISFFLGVFWNARGQKEPLRVYNSAFNNSGLDNSGVQKGVEKLPSTQGEESAASAILAPGKSGESVVASKNGTKYHYPWCAGAKQISEKNKVTFASIEEARAKGYTPASNCKGLK